MAWPKSSPSAPTLTEALLAKKRLVLRPDSEQIVSNLQRQTCAIIEATGISVGTVVDKARRECVQREVNGYARQDGAHHHWRFQVPFPLDWVKRQAGPVAGVGSGVQMAD